MQTRILPGTGPDLEASVEALCAELESGGVVGLPTETVYGLAGDALNAAAAARIFEVKERPFFDPLICHVPDFSWVDRLAHVPVESRVLVEDLARAFWPGPLTLVLPRRECVPDLVSSGLPTVALRWSAHALFTRVVARFGRPLAAPSANRFGRISPTTAEHVRSELEGRIRWILDGGPSAHGVESTIVAFADSGLRVLRAGPVTREQLGGFAPVLPAVERHAAPGEGEASVVEAPGQIASHYAPRTPLYLLEEGEPVGESVKECGLLAWRTAREGFARVEVLAPGGDARAGAACLFAALRRMDEAGLVRIYAEKPPRVGLGEAIHDRLRRAAAQWAGA